ncbi:MAG: hypothetical protein KJ712_06410 [Bacteroidetes bacterium]|nr:hypothetical protein [Bacteroidota bacterium]MBU1483946.1 hypothetical protein [Bacteroidota bacterium]MBU1761940.1 hypothetical protein [Bacteroidota bacterium]MBU2046345.1 hypothetical protein [Bacteroidota bacterium]MBU2268467.1 hypothetical protein [Bacteroidota bacterium]
MQKIGNVSLYLDDLEIVDILSEVPSPEGLSNKSILKFIEEDTIDNDFGTICFHSDLIYTIYKFDKKFHPVEDAGLIMTVSNKIYSLEQLHIWKGFKSKGTDFSAKIFEMIENYLTGAYYVGALNTKTK